MKTDAFDELNAGVDKDGKAVGDECFVVIHHEPPVKGGPHFERRDRVFKGRAIRHFPREGHVQVQTDAAKHLWHSWQHLSFEWEDGQSVFDPKHTRLIVATTMAEQEALEERVRVGVYQFPEELIPAPSVRDLSMIETPQPSCAKPVHFGLFAPPEDSE